MGTSDVARPRFEKDTGFYRALKHRVDHFFDEAGLRRRDSPFMYVKTALILLWFAASYFLLVFVAWQWWQAVLLATSLALAIAGVGFGIQHDANHGAYSSRDGLNRVMGITLDLLGAS